jgi:hypothetical protein
LQPLRSMWRHMRSGGSTDDSTGPLARNTCREGERRSCVFS